MTELTPNFTLAEFTASDTAKRMGDPNKPTAAHLANIKATALGLEQVRRMLGNAPVRITSGYRNKAVNEKVGGVPTSAHALGYAADITVDGIGHREVAERIRDSVLVFDQVIWEPSRGIVHISFDPRLRREVKTQRGGPGSPVTWGVA